MRNEQRLYRLEQAYEERVLRKEAERLAKEYGLNPDDLLRDAQAMAERVQRWGFDEEIRRFAEESGLTEEEVRARYEEACREIEAEDR